jgi:hypothetical protein
MHYYVSKIFTLSEINPELEQLEVNNKYIMRPAYRVKLQTLKDEE